MENAHGGQAAPFRERVEEFWNWFRENEERLAALVASREKETADTIILTFSEGTDRIREGLHFHVGGDYEFTFAVSGDDYLFYLLPYVVARRPRDLRYDWKFYPCTQSTGGGDFTLCVNDVEVSASEIAVGMDYDAERLSFALRFWNEKLAAADENLAYTIFYLLMEHGIGEGLSRIYIDEALRLDAPQEGLFPLTGLEAHMRACISESGKELFTLPDQRYTVYEMEPEENEDPRYDIQLGTTCFTSLVNDYYEDDPVNADGLESCGAKALYLLFPVAGREGKEALERRHVLQDRLEAEVLGERGSGHEIGLLLGGALGRENAYIDLLLYDEQAFFEKVRALRDCGEALRICGWRRHDAGRALFE